MSALRWGFLGASRIGRRLAPAMIAAEGHALVAVGARDLDRARAFAAEYAMPHAYAGYQAVIDDPEVDAVYIALTNEAHLPWTLAALAAGKHVLCEKPLALNAAEVAAMIASEAASGRRVMEAFCHFHNRQFAVARALIAEGAIGRVVSMGCLYTGILADGDFRWHAAMGGGALFDLGVYALSMMRLLTGREPLRVAAFQSARGDVDATLAASLDFGDGLTAEFTCSMESPRTQSLTIIGTEGRIEFDFPFSTLLRVTTLRLVRSDRDDHVESFAPMDPYVPMVEHFGHAVERGAPMLHPMSASLAQARALDALFASARTGRLVAVGPDA